MPFPNNRHGNLHEFFVDVMIARADAAFRHEAGSVLRLEAPYQSPDLAHDQPKSAGSLARLQLAINDLFNYFQPIQRAHRHRDTSGFVHGDLPVSR